MYMSFIKQSSSSDFMFCCSEEATKVMVELLRTYTEENAAQAKDDAKSCIVKCLARPNLFVMDHLLGLRPVQALKGDPVHEVRIQ